jgi:hypothetical protein
MSGKLGCYLAYERIHRFGLRTLRDYRARHAWNEYFGATLADDRLRRGRSRRVPTGTTAIRK